MDTEVWRGEQVIGRGEALNDIVVNSGASAQMIEFELSIDGEFVYRLNADGLLVATPQAQPPTHCLRVARSCTPVSMLWCWYLCSRIR